MDRKKIIKEYENYVNNYISLNANKNDDELEMHKAVLTVLKEQAQEISFLKKMQLQTISSMKDEDVGDAVASVFGLKGW